MKTRQEIGAAIVAIGLSLTQAASAQGVNNSATCNNPYRMSQPVENQTVNPSLRYVNVRSNRDRNATDPDARLARVANAGNDTSLAAVGNTFSEDTSAPNTNIIKGQTNNSVEAVVNTTINNVAVSASAIGISAQIVHY